MSEQEIGSSEHRTIYDQEKHKGSQLQARSFSEHEDTPDISCFYVTVMWPIHTAPDQTNTSWTRWRIQSWENSRQEDH